MAFAPAAQASDADLLLARYRPVLAYDREERFFATSVEAMAGRVAPAPAGRPTPVVYGRVTPDRRWLQYWLFFADNPQDRGIFRTGRHAGDWELLQLGLDSRARPVAATLSQHTWAVRCGWRALRHRDGAPFAYVANGSHALYPRAGAHDRPWPDPTDEARGRGPRVRAPVERIDARSPAWVRWPGRWGETRASWIPGEQSSPRGPRFAYSGAWGDPAGYEARARPCLAGAPGRPWQWPAVAALLLALGVVARLIRRRGRPRSV